MHEFVCELIPLTLHLIMINGILSKWKILRSSDLQEQVRIYDIIMSYCIFFSFKKHKPSRKDFASRKECKHFI